MSDDYATYAQASDIRLLDSFARQVSGGHLTTRGLTDLRRRLDGREFMPGPQRDLLALDVATALARRLGIPVEDLPGHPASDIPDSPGGIAGLDKPLGPVGYSGGASPSRTKGWGHRAGASAAPLPSPGS